MSIATLILLAAATPGWVWWTLAIALAVGLTALGSDSKARVQSPSLRVPVPTDAAPIWIGLGVMAIFYISTPVVCFTLFGVAKTAATQATIDPDTIARLVKANMATYVSAILSGVLIHLYMRSPAKRFLGLAKPRAPQLRLLLIACLVAIPLTYLISGLTQGVLNWLQWEHADKHPMLGWMAELRDRPLLRAAAILSATVLAPVFEELFFRGHLQTALVGLLPNRWVGIALASFLFASLHPGWTMPAIFVLSMCLGALYERTNSLWMPIGLHIAFNGISTAVFLTR